ncbi:glucose-6-phosphate isomerase [Chloroflexota bacterium]
MDTSIGQYLAAIEATTAELEKQDVLKRIWRRDHTVWKPEPTEITNRLGWLTVTGMMQEKVPALESFASEVRAAGFRHLILLGMGGSSLGSEVLRQTCGSAAGYPELIVLDSTLPGRVQAVTESIDPAHTLFLVSSKSGTTIEPLSLLEYFRSLVASAIGSGKSGQNFVAITDQGTPLVKYAEEKGFRHIFLNPTDIGGRYSVLSYFGLVPAALAGIDIKTLLSRADDMRRRCGITEYTHENPGVWLGAVIGAMMRQGRDKLTLVTSPGVGSFGLWVEQIIAESIGKEGKGIIPVVAEPLLEPMHYGNDRLFIYLRLQTDDNSVIDTAIEKLESSGQPVVVIDIRDSAELGAEFFRWEFATAVAGSILGVHPFDQPDVQAAKEATEQVLQEFLASGSLPQVESNKSFADLLAMVKEGMYLVIMAYVQQNAEVDALLTELRRKVLYRYRIATMLGYGPRYLHSTGQLHKGGPEKGLFLLITTDHEKDLAIPGKPYTFGSLADAQALGDLRALKALGRQVAKVHLEHGDTSVISQLIDGLA